MNQTSSKPKRKSRSRKLIKPGLQLRFSMAFVGLACFASLVMVLILSAVIHRALEQGGIDPAAIDTSEIILIGLLGTLTVLVPTMTAVGILLTHRIAGPVYRFEQHFSALARGEDPGRCKIRSGDELQELCELINAGLETVRVRDGNESDRKAA
ncbi:MAG: signal transduction histidine kinase [Planctomycetota bacterium]|jgi:signal transduction histidine kinase